MSPDRECEVVVKAYTNTYDATVEEVYQSLINNTEEILHNRQKDNWYVFSWIEGQIMFYRKEVISRKGSRSIDTKKLTNKRVGDIMNKIFSS